MFLYQTAIQRYKTYMLCWKSATAGKVLGDNNVHTVQMYKSLYDLDAWTICTRLQ